MENNPEASENSRLISVLQSGFNDLIKKQDEIQKALEDLKRPALAADPKTVFWNSYMKLADEYDKEVQQKYSTDLDTGLIFAGLFSAVSSAFIIQIQPSITPKTTTIIIVVQTFLYVTLFTTLLAALLGVLGKQWVMYYQAAGSRGTIEERGLERQRKLDGILKWKFNTILEIFPLFLQFALLLFSVALSIYLWTVNKTMAIVVLAISSVGFGFYIFLILSSMLSLDSPFRTPFTPALRRLYLSSRRGFTHFGTFLGQLALFCCWSLCVSMHRTVPPKNSRPFTEDEAKAKYNPYAEIYFAPPSTETSAVLWVLETSTDPVIITAAAELVIDLEWPLNLDPTPHMMRLAETFESCFNVRYDGYMDVSKLREGMLRRAVACGRAYCSLRLVARASGLRLDRRLGLRFTGDSMRVEGGSPTESAQLPLLANVVHLLEEFPDARLGADPLLTIKWALHVIPSLTSSRSMDSVQMKVAWFLDSFDPDKILVDESIFAAYLCCLNSFFGPVNPRVLVLKDKSLLKPVFLKELFKALQRAHMDAVMVSRLVETTAKFASMVPLQPTAPPEQGPDVRWSNLAAQISHIGTNDKPDVMSEVSRFCTAFATGSETRVDTLVSAAILARVEPVSDLPHISALASPMRSKSRGVNWIYISLQHVQSESGNGDPDEPAPWDDRKSLAIESLLQVLASSGTVTEKPTLKALEIILEALSASEDIPAIASFLILDHNRDWFLDPELLPIMQTYSAWARLGASPRAPNQDYISIGSHIAHSPAWKPVIYRELSTWIDMFAHRDRGWGCTARWTIDQFSAVIRNVWVPHFPQYTFTNESEKSWALALTALANVWEAQTFDLVHNPDFFDGFFAMAQSTVATALRAEYFRESYDFGNSSYVRMDIPSELRAVFSVKLGTAVLQAASRAREVVSRDSVLSSSPASLDLFSKLVGWMEVFGRTVSTDLDPGAGELYIGSSTTSYHNWSELRQVFEGELDSVADSIT